MVSFKANYDGSTPVTPSPTSSVTSSVTSPTPQPTTSGGGSSSGDYEWYWFHTYSDCDLSCISDGDVAYKTKIYLCSKVTKSGNTIYYNQVDDSMCDAGTKPTESVACEDGDVPVCESTCGDGLVGINEACDTNAANGECCSDDCLSYKTDTIDCWLVNSVIN